MSVGLWALRYECATEIVEDYRTTKHTRNTHTQRLIMTHRLRVIDHNQPVFVVSFVRSCVCFNDSHTMMSFNLSNDIAPLAGLNDKRDEVGWFLFLMCVCMMIVWMGLKIGDGGADNSGICWGVNILVWFFMGTTIQIHSLCMFQI